MHRLTGNLSDTFSCNKRKTIILISKMFCNLHHITAHNDRKLIMWTLLIDCHLNICKVNDMQSDRSCILCNLFCKIYYFLFRSLTCIWRCMEVSCVNAYTPLGNHVTSYRAVNTTGKKKHCSSVCTNRHSTRSRNLSGINVNLITNLDCKHNIWIMHVNT